MKDCLGYNPIYEANLALLKRSQVPYVINEGYEKLMEKYKELKNTKFELLQPEKITSASSVAAWEGPTQEKPYSRVVMVDFTRKDLERVYNLYRHTREAALKIIACRTFGTDDAEDALSVFDEHPDLFGLTLVGHELGHEHEFQKVFVPQFPNNPIQAAQLYSDNYNHQMTTLPLGMHTHSADIMFQNRDEKDELLKFYEQNVAYFAYLGINSYAELVREFPRLLIENQIAYRDLPSERYADEVAAAAVQAVVRF